jgi:P-type Cu+ transporter
MMRTMEVPIKGMDCAHCTATVQQAIAKLPGIQSVSVLLSSEKAVIQLDPQQVDVAAIRKAVEGAGYSVPEVVAQHSDLETDLSRSIFNLFGIVFGAILLLVVAGEGLGLLDAVTSRVPWVVGLALVLIGGYPIFLNVIRAALRRQVISHTLMSLGVVAALAIGEWATAAVVVFFMRIGDYAEHFTTERSRQAVKNLTALAPQIARIEQDGQEREVSIAEVTPGAIVIVRPGEKIPVDGEVLSGQATVNQAAITGESMPVEVQAGAKVFAATFASLGSLRIRVTQVGAETTFGRIIKLVEEAEAHRADVQRIADKFSAYYLPVVATIAALTYLLSRDPLATAAVMLVACSCSFALATPIAMLASVGAAAKNGLLIKGGKYIEALARADVLLIDKTGTLTLGQPQVTDVITLNGLSRNTLLSLAASAERYSEHPLAEAVRQQARTEALNTVEPQKFEAVPGQGIQAVVNGHQIAVGNRRMIPAAASLGVDLEAAGKTTLFVTKDHELVGIIAAADTLRSEVPGALASMRELGIKKIELLTGDNERVAAALAQQLGIDYRASLLPQDKIDIVKAYQAQGHQVVMVGDGINDAPALAQANVGIAMGAAGTDVAIEAAHIALMREDWTLVPEALRIAQRTMRVVKTNLGFTVIYNTIGLTLAAFGFLPPIVAAAAQSLPDLGIMANSSRLLHHQRSDKAAKPLSFVEQLSQRPYAKQIAMAALLVLVAAFIGFKTALDETQLSSGVVSALDLATVMVVILGFMGFVGLQVFIQSEKLEAAEAQGISLISSCCDDGCACATGVTNAQPTNVSFMEFVPPTSLPQKK